MEQKLPEERIERVIKTTNPFKDERGEIDNYDLEFPVNMANRTTKTAKAIAAMMIVLIEMLCALLPMVTSLISGFY